MNSKFNIAIGADHGAVDLKNSLSAYMSEAGHTVTDIGVFDHEKADYPDIALQLATIILDGKAERGILLCGTGIGISIAANRFPGIRAALCHDEYTARMSRQHNNANVIAMGGRTTGIETAKAMLDVWLTTEFEGGRHIPRLDKIESHASQAWAKYLSK